MAREGAEGWMLPLYLQEQKVRGEGESELAAAGSPLWGSHLEVGLNRSSVLTAGFYSPPGNFRFSGESARGHGVP